MYKKCKVVMLATETKNKIWFNDNKTLSSYNHDQRSGSPGITQHLYILSDDEIKEGDWFINRQYFIENDNKPEYDIWQYDGKIKPNSEPKKIIATTDSSLEQLISYDSSIEDSEQYKSLPSIPQSFIDHYVSRYNKGNKIEEVMVEYESIKDYGCADCGDPDTWDVNTGYYKVKLNSDNTINIKAIKDSWTRDEVLSLCNAAFYHKDVGKGLPYDYKENSFNKWIESNL